MRKFRLIAAATAVAASAFAFGTAAPASAGTAACAGQGTITLSGISNLTGGLWAPVLGAPANVGAVNGSISCLGGVTTSAVTVTGGLVNAACGRSEGDPTNPIKLTAGTDTHSFEIFQTLGTMLLGVDTDGIGVVLGNAVADPLHSHAGHPTNSCTNGTAHSFIVTGLGATVL